MTQTADKPKQKMRTVEIHAGIKIKVPVVDWTPRERAAWYWPEPMKPSAWAEKYRRLEKSAVPGRWRNATAPYLVGIMDMTIVRGVIRLVIKKAAQLGVSEGMRSAIGYWAHYDPSPTGLALPNKEKGREIVENEMLPFFRDTFGRHPELRQLLTGRMHDLKKGQIKLANAFIMHLMWSGSPSSLASNPMKRAFCDEVNKFQKWSGDDADPVSLIDKRLRTFPDSMNILVSTPTYAAGEISVNFRACTHRLYYLVACPHCGQRQRLTFGDGGETGVKWNETVRGLFKGGNRNAAAAAVLADPTACWYQCAACRGKIYEPQKRQMVQGGVWGTVESQDVGEGVIADGLLAGGPVADVSTVKEFPRGTWIGMHISALYCLWEICTMAHVAAEFLRARGMSQMFDFRTGTLGEDWEETQRAVKKEDALQLVVETAKAGVAPKWTGRLLATVDTQKDHFYVVIRAWGPGMRSRRIRHGIARSFEEVEQWCLRTPYANEDARLPARVCDLIFIDSGGTRHVDDETEGGSGAGPLPSRVMEVYAWALKHQAHVRCIKGDARPMPGSFIRRGRGEYVSGQHKATVPLTLLDVHHFQDELADQMARRAPVVNLETGEVTATEPAWALARSEGPGAKEIDEEYGRHLSNMRKVCEGRGESMAWKWRPVPEGARVDYRMCEVYQTAAAYIAGVHVLPDYKVFMQFLEAQAKARQSPTPRPGTLNENPWSMDGRPFVASDR